MSAELIGNISKTFDCDKLIAQIKEHEGETHTGHHPLPQDHPEYHKFLEQDLLAQKAGYYENDAMNFKHFKPNRHFDSEFIDIFCDYIEAYPLVVFVSEIKPGKMAPWHFDIDPDEQENKKKGELVRFHLHLSQAENGHIFIIDDDVFYNIPQGNVYKWDNVFSWHAGANCGLVPKYLLNFKGYR